MKRIRVANGNVIVRIPASGIQEVEVWGCGKTCLTIKKDSESDSGVVRVFAGGSELDYLDFTDEGEIETDADGNVLMSILDWLQAGAAFKTLVVAVAELTEQVVALRAQTEVK